MPSTKTEASRPTSKTAASGQAQDQTLSGAEEQTQAQETTETATNIDEMLAGIGGEKQEAPKKELRGVLHVEFFTGHHFEVKVEGKVSEAQVERALVGIYRTIGNSKVAALRKSRADMKLAVPLLQDKPVSATA